jgi:hypothetical protein
MFCSQSLALLTTTMKILSRLLRLIEKLVTCGEKMFFSKLRFRTCFVDHGQMTPCLEENKYFLNHSPCSKPSLCIGALDLVQFNELQSTFL